MSYNSSDLWKKVKNSEGSEQYVDLFETNPSSGGVDIASEIATYSVVKKDNSISLARILEAKKQFGNRNFESAIELCNSALRYGELGSKSTLNAYIIRSECFFILKMYDKCVKDIDLAIGDEIDEKNLTERRIKCLKLLEKVAEPSSCRATLSFEADNDYPCMANILKIGENERFGLHVVAKQDIAVGQVVVVEESFASTAESGDSTMCATCRRTRMNFIACENCPNAMFCDIDCKNKNLVHIYECGISSSYKFPDGSQIIFQSVLLALAMFPSFEELMQFVEGVIAEESRTLPKSIHDQQSKYRFFLKLHTDAPKTLDLACYEADKANLIYVRILELLSIKKNVLSENQKRFLKHLIVKHVRIVKSNAFHEKVDENSRSNTTLSVIFLVTSLLNHSCAPNLCCIDHLNRKYLITIRPIKKGEQLFINYCNHVGGDSDVRRQNLIKQRGFSCECDRCVVRRDAISQMNMMTDENMITTCHNIKRAVESKFESKDGIADAGDSCDDVFRSVRPMCETFLNTYGHHPWCEPMQVMMNIYRECLESFYLPTK